MGGKEEEEEEEEEEKEEEEEGPSVRSYIINCNLTHQPCSSPSLPCRALPCLIPQTTIHQSVDIAQLTPLLMSLPGDINCSLFVWRLSEGLDNAPTPPLPQPAHSRRPPPSDLE